MVLEVREGLPVVVAPGVVLVVEEALVVKVALEVAPLASGGRVAERLVE